MAERTVTPRLAPLVLATMASQALLVLLAPTIPAIARDLGASVGEVGQARSITAVAAMAAALMLARANLALPRLLAAGSVLALAALAAVAASPSLPVFLGAHVLLGLGFACLLTAGFAGVAAFPPGRRAWAMGHVAGANGLAWIVVNPAVGAATEWISWRVAVAVPGAVVVAALAAAPRASCVACSADAVPLRVVVREASARRWMAAELIAYAGWAGLLTFVGAYFVDGLGLREGVAGWLLAAGAAAYVLAAGRSGRLAERFGRRRLVAVAGLALAALSVALLRADAAPAAAIFCLAGLAAGLRTPASGSLGLDQLPGSGAAMMAVRSAVTQLGYLVGALGGGVVLAVGGYGAVGLALGAATAASAALVLRVRDPREAAAHGPGGSPEAKRARPVLRSFASNVESRRRAVLGAYVRQEEGT